MTAADRPLPTDALQLLTTDPGPWLSCDDCFRLVDRYVEALLSGGAEPASSAHAEHPTRCAGMAASSAGVGASASDSSAST